MIKVSFFRQSLPLSVPYDLSFTSLDSFELFYVVAEKEGRFGYGEVTPLPGYGTESCQSITDALKKFSVSLADCQNQPWDFIRKLTKDYPFLASGIACALETLDEGVATAYQTPISKVLPLVGLCAGSTPEVAASNAKTLISNGFRTLKLKVGGPAGIEADLSRVRAVSNVTSAKANLRLDANQSFHKDEAARFCAALSGFPIELVEQPLSIGAWNDTAELIASTTVPIMLDESISSTRDIIRAREIGAQWVKLKLCKHPGMMATKHLVKIAQANGLKLVFGNGVQSAVGNHLESRIFDETGIIAAGEQNGFLKIKNSPNSDEMYIKDGFLVDLGVSRPEANIDTGKAAIATWYFWE